MVAFLVVLWLAVIADGDARTSRIPNVTVWPGLCAVFATATMTPTVGVAATVAALPYAICHRAGWCGGGDVKLAGVCGGLVVHWDVALVLVGSAALAAALVLAASPRRRALPHGPFLVAVTLPLAALL
ncbi:A24 family peptidase [Gordonia sp. ABSL1-1]|uniref:A24 family peptidase n=1 Tax=Gordonia sp. ABSL1-1 TaxID=3053923 RepID=UPI0025747DC1|nr:A24 family peptidase [Gordonia sp. ABSL1-1]MDL9937306.1 A24 family peptidase [Gordonia sp. ABSL1-1]